MSDNQGPGQSGIPPATAGAASPLSRLLRHLNAALAVALLALVLAVWNWLNSHQGLNLLEQDLSKRLAEFDSRGRESHMLAAQAQEGAREAAVKLGLLEQKLAESQNQLLALESMYQELAKSRDEWVLAEVEQILLIASQQLQLAGNVKAALLALQTADSRLQRLDKPQFYILRKAITRDIDRLRAAPSLDVTGTSLRLDGLVAAVDDLPLALESEPQADKGRAAPKPVPAERGWKRLGREVWQDFMQLVRIRTAAQPDAPLLSPTQSYFLRENLKLRLLSARLALLQRDDSGFKADLKACEAWLSRYFDTRAKPTMSALSTLRQLAASPVGAELPDISESLAAVRSYKLARERGGR